MNDLLVEIGAEEIPAGYIIPALEAFRDNLLTALDRARIECGEVSIYGTPRRLALMIKDVSDSQKPVMTTMTGPPASVGFKDDGTPTISAEKFAEKAGVPLSDITITDTGKGKYLTAVKSEKCESSQVILENILPAQIQAIPFPKRMHWGTLSVLFARPIVSLLALLGNTQLNFAVGDIESSDFTLGHFFMYHERFKVPEPNAYVDVLKRAGVLVDIKARKALLKQEIEKAASEYSSTILKDDELEDIVTNLVEYPYPVVGKFDEEFLELPDEVLITAMREHQKYFALADENGSLRPCFVAVNNTKAKDMDLVAAGHGRVIRARLADAKFFYHVDMESTMDAFAQKLKKVTFQAQLGSMYEKRERLMELSGYLAEAARPGNCETLKKDVIRAADICKADLVSQVVIEFTKLQGIVGRIYAQKAGENNEVSGAVEQHYRPVYSGGELPETDTARLLAIADKIDTICGCFSVDLIPTGASDPYALRRQSIGIIQIMLDAGFTFSLKALVDKSISLYGGDSHHAKQVLEFIRNRMTNMLIDQGHSREAVNSALSASFDNVPDALMRIKALEVLRQAPDFEPLSIAFKRVVNILKKSGMDEVRGGFYADVDEGLFEDDAERALFKVCQRAADQVQAGIAEGNYGAALKEIADLRPDVDRFFDDVMVMVDDESIKNNRLALLASVAGLFKNIADFSQI